MSNLAITGAGAESSRHGPRAAPVRARLVGIAAALGAVAVAIDSIAAQQLSGRYVSFGLLDLRLVHNSGVAFSVGGQLPAWIVLTMTGATTATLAVYFWRKAPDADSVGRVAMAVIIAGATANVIDRARDGAVTDYFYTGWWPTFNLADCYLVVGAVLLVASIVRADKRNRTRKARLDAPEPTT